MDIKKSVDRIKALSKDRGFKMKHLCTKLGVRENYFNDCKNKNLTIPDNLISTLAIMLETTVEYLKGETDDPMFHLSSIGMKTIPYESKGTRLVYGHTSAGLGVPLSAYPNPTLCGERYSFKPKDTPYLNR